MTTNETMQVSDLSAGGCFIATRALITAGSDVTILAKFAGVELALTGRVVHVKPERGFAIEFLNLPSNTRYMLEHFLTRAPGPG